MKFLLTTLTFTFLTNLVYAKNIDGQIEKACLRHSVSLVTKLKSEVIGDLTQQKSDQALKLANESCQAYFKKEFTDTTEVVTSLGNENDKQEKQSILDKILNSETSEKEGNKRLKRQQ